MKKAQGISLNTIIIAAIALLVLVILAIIFMVRMGVFSQNSNDCKQYQGDCSQGLRCEREYEPHPLGLCYDSNERDYSNTCCVRAVSR